MPGGGAVDVVSAWLVSSKELMNEVQTLERLRVKERVRVGCELMRREDNKRHSIPRSTLDTVRPLEQWQAECAPGMTSV